MAQIKPFKLKSGTRIGNYTVEESLGHGWEGEAYKVREVPTEAKRALKLFRVSDFESIREITHFAWYYNEVQSTGHFPIYHHYGQCFLEDDDGCIYLVFELIEGTPVSKMKATEDLFFKIATAVANVQKEGYGVGDFEELKDVIVRSRDGKIIFLDCDPGKPDAPNIRFKKDYEELAEAARLMFKNEPPKRVAEFLMHLRKGENSLEEALSLVLS